MIEGRRVFTAARKGCASGCKNSIARLLQKDVRRARYLDPKTSRWLSTDPALGEYMAGSNAGAGGIYNQVNFNLYHYAGNNPIKYIDPTGREDENANKVLDSMFEQKMDIYLSKDMCEKVGLDFEKGENKIQTEAQLNEAKKYTKSITSGKDGYTINFEDKSRTSYDNNGNLQYYESEYNPTFPLLGVGNSYGLKDGDFQKIITAIEIIQVGTVAISAGKGLTSGKSLFRSPKGNIRIERGLESVPKSTQRSLGVKLSGAVEKPWHLYIYGKEIRLNPFNPNWRYFPKK